MIDWMWFTDKDSSEHIGNKTRYHGGSLGFNHAVVTTEAAPAEACYVRIDARLYADGEKKSNVVQTPPSGRLRRRILLNINVNTVSAGDADSEFLLPTVVGGMNRSTKGTLRVLPTADHWFGMTYAQDIGM